MSRIWFIKLLRNESVITYKFLSKMKYIYTPYVWFVGGLSFIFISMYELIGVKFTTPEKLFPFVSRFFRFLLKILFIRVKVEYHEEIDTKKTYIFMPNHSSFIDVVLAGAYIPVYVNALEDESHFNWFYYGKVIKAYEHIPISKKNPRKALQSFEIAKQYLKRGRSIIVFPEGHRSEDGKVKRFKKIPFRFVKDANVDLVPVGFSGLKKLRQKGKVWMSPGKLKIAYGKIITIKEIKELTTDELMEKTRNSVINLIEL